MPNSRFIIALLVATIAFVGVMASFEAGHKVGNVPYDEQIKPVESTDTTKFVTNTVDKSFYASTSDDTSSIVDKLKVAVTPQQFKVVDPISAESYIVGDLNTGKVYLSKNIDKVLPFASMSKLITALVADDMYDASTTIAITEENLFVPKERIGLRAGEVFSAKEILYPLLLNSSNIAAEAISSSTNRTEFLDLMLGYSWEIGMPQSNFADPSGLSDNNAGTARGFFNMAKYLFDNRKKILSITRVASFDLATTTLHDAHKFTNIHPFVNDPKFLGGKTGHTPTAQDTMLTILNIYNHPVAFIVLRSNDRYRDTLLLEDKLVISRNL